MKEKILDLLKNSEDEFVSGQKLSEILGVTRAAIWKYINQLKEDGYKIESVSKKGYKIVSCPDLLTYEEIKDFLNTKYIGRNILHFDSVDSTNTKAKSLASSGEKNGTLVIGEEQTMGRGRLGRTWVSPKHTGIWMSLILRPNIDPVNVAIITQIGAAAVAKSILNLNITPNVKWPNDIIVNGKKVCGILTEMSCELNQVNYIVMGIGINVNQNISDFPGELKHIASSLKCECSNSVSRKKLVADILNNFEILYDDFIGNNNIKPSIDLCRKLSNLIGKEIDIINRGKTECVTVLDLNDLGQLVVKYSNNQIESLISGEVTMHDFYKQN